MAGIYGSLLSASGTGQSANFIALRPPAYTRVDGSALRVEVLVGAASGDTPSPHVRTFSGFKQYTSFDDWYHRLHFYPVRFDLGNLIGRQQRALTVWNAHFNPVSLESFTLVGGEGITITQPVTPPSVMAPLESLKYEIEVSTDGPPAIDATAQFVIDGVRYDIPISGRRVVVFPFKPNWSSPVEETLEWLTALTVTYTGKEQVSEIRVEPRRIMQFNVRLHRGEANLFDNIVYGWGGRMFAMPLWQEKAKTASVAVAGTETIEAPSFARTFVPGGMALLYRNSLDFEIVEIESVTGDTLKAARPLAGTWPKDSLIVPLMVGALDAGVPTTRQSDAHIDAVIRFTSSPRDNNPRIAHTTAATTYMGEELYTGETNWVAALRVEMLTRETRTDSETGIFKLVKRAPFPEITRGFSWMVKNKQEAETLREFFGRRRGRLKPVWIPSGSVDFRLLETSTPAQSTLLVENTEYGTMVNMQGARRNVVIMMRDGERICRRIDAYGVDATGRGLLTLDTAVGRELTRENVKKISYLGLYRLGSDSVTFTWLTDRGATIETNLVLKESPL